MTTLPQLTADNQIIVDRQAAKLGSPRERVLPIDSNHREICKFSSDKSDEDRFAPVMFNLKQMAENARHQTKHDPQGRQGESAPGV